jgi:hypothetical protein
MKAIIEIKMDNAAFEAAPKVELHRILRQLSGNVLNEGGVHRVGDSIAAIDINGNTVGKLEIVED